MATSELIDDFLNGRRLAVVGVSRDAKAFANTLFRELRTRGYDVVPVNPGADELEGTRCYTRVQDATPAVEGALGYVSPAAAEALAADCFAAAAPRIWFAGPAPRGFRKTLIRRNPSRRLWYTTERKE